MRKKDQEFDFEHVKLKIPVRHSGEEIPSRQWDICVWNSKRRSGVKT